MTVPQSNSLYKTGGGIKTPDNDGELIQTVDPGAAAPKNHDNRPLVPSLIEKKVMLKSCHSVEKMTGSSRPKLCQSPPFLREFS